MITCVIRICNAKRTKNGLTKLASKNQGSRPNTEMYVHSDSRCSKAKRQHTAMVAKVTKSPILAHRKQLINNIVLLVWQTRNFHYIVAELYAFIAKYCSTLAAQNYCSWAKIINCYHLHVGAFVFNFLLQQIRTGK